MTTVDHVRRELELCGQTTEDPWYAACLVAAAAAFTSYGHSGGSASMAIEQLHTLLLGGTLSPLTNEPADWIDRTAESGYPLWQNRRCTAAFSTDAGATFWLVDKQVHVSGLGEPIGTYGRDAVAVYASEVVQ